MGTAVNLSVEGSRMPSLHHTKAKLRIIVNQKFRLEQFLKRLAAMAQNDGVCGVVEYSAAPEQHVASNVLSVVLLSANLCRSHLSNFLRCNLPSVAVDRLALKLVSTVAGLAAENVEFHKNMGFDIVVEMEVIGISRVGDHVTNYASQFPQSSRDCMNHHGNQAGTTRRSSTVDLAVESAKILRSRHEWLVTGNGKLEDERCSICWEEFSPGIELARLKPCNHIYHPNCLLQWMLDNHNSCPLCRGPILSPYFIK